MIYYLSNLVFMLAQNEDEKMWTDRILDDPALDMGDEFKPLVAYKLDFPKNEHLTVMVWDKSGKMVLSSGGSAQVKLNEGAVLSANIYGGDTQTTLSALKDYNGSQYTMEMKNGIASNFVLDNDSLLNVYSGGIAENVIVDDSLIQVDYKGTVNSATIADVS